MCNVNLKIPYYRGVFDPLEGCRLKKNFNLMSKSTEKYSGIVSSTLTLIIYNSTVIFNEISLSSTCVL